MKFFFKNNPCILWPHVGAYCKNLAILFLCFSKSDELWIFFITPKNILEHVSFLILEITRVRAFFM